MEKETWQECAVKHTHKVSLFHVVFWFCDAGQCFQKHSEEHKGKGVFLEGSLENELTPQKCRFTQHNRLSRTKPLRIYLAKRETKRQNYLNVLHFSFAI